MQPRFLLSSSLAGAILLLSAAGARAQAPPNDLCANAQPLVFAGNTFTPGTTNGATVDTDAPADCGTAHVNAPGVWYTFTGNGFRALLSTCPDDGGDATFDSQISVYSGDCGSLTCVTGNDDTPGGCQSGTYSSLTFCTELDVVYHVLVHGSAVDPNDQGDFVLALIQQLQCKSSCETATEIVAPGTYDGDTTESGVGVAPRCDEFSSCDVIASNDWFFHLVGNGNTFTFSTCPDNGGALTFDTAIGVYCGGCSALQCIVANDDDATCASDSLASTVTMCTEAGKEYWVIVYSTSPDLGGPFTLAVSEGAPCTDPPAGCPAPPVECCSPCEVLGLLEPVLPPGSISSTHPCLMRVDPPPGSPNTAPTFELPQGDPAACCPYFDALVQALPGHPDVPSTHPCFVAPPPPPPPPPSTHPIFAKGNNGVGNGEDPQPPGNPPINDGPGTAPGKPGNKKKAHLDVAPVAIVAQGPRLSLPVSRARRRRA